MQLDASASGSGAGTPTSAFVATDVPIVSDRMAFHAPPADNAVRHHYAATNRAETHTFVFSASGQAVIQAVAATAIDGVSGKEAQDQETDDLACTSLPWHDWWGEDDEEAHCADTDSCATCLENVDPNPWPPTPRICIPRDCDGSPNQPWECCDECEDSHKPECANAPWIFCAEHLVQCAEKALLHVGPLVEKACSLHAPVTSETVRNLRILVSGEVWGRAPEDPCGAP